MACQSVVGASSRWMHYALFLILSLEIYLRRGWVLRGASSFRDGCIFDQRAPKCTPGSSLYLGSRVMLHVGCIHFPTSHCKWSQPFYAVMWYPHQVFYLAEFVAKYDWVHGFLFPKGGFATLAQRFRCHWVLFLKEAFWDLCPETSLLPKLVASSAWLVLKACGIQLIIQAAKQHVDYIDPS